MNKAAPSMKKEPYTLGFRRGPPLAEVIKDSTSYNMMVGIVPIVYMGLAYRAMAGPLRRWKKFSKSVIRKMYCFLTINNINL